VPSPSLVFEEARAADVIDGNGAPVAVSGRFAAKSPPARVRIKGSAWCDVVAWAGPWPVDEKWWDESAHRRRARFQVALADGTAHLLSLEEGRWQLEATYD
jgi:protein ImuB